MKTEAWDYSVLQSFHEQYYEHLLLKAHIIGTRKAIKHDDNAEDHTVVYILQKDRKNYALPEELIEELPLLATKTFQRVDKKEVYDIITRYSTARFKAEKHFSFKELVENFIPFSHENPLAFKLWKIIVLASYITRLNIRVATSAGFGKDSAIKTLGSLFGDVMMVSNPTIAKLEYCLHNKLLMLNEVVDLEKTTKRDLEQFFLGVGDLSNKYTKRSRAGTDGSESYDISKLSLILCYNSKDHYPEGHKYFDDQFQKAVRERFLPLLFTGSITHRFLPPINPEKTAKTHKDWFVKYIRSIEWYKHRWREELEELGVPEPSETFTGRWGITHHTVHKFVRLYTQGNKEEEAQLLAIFEKAYYDYKRMTNGGTNDLGLYQKVEKEELVVEHEDIQL